MKSLSSYLPESFALEDDCTPFIRRALAENMCLYIEPGIYRLNDITIPDNTVLVGSGAGTILKSAGGITIFKQRHSTGWIIRDLAIDGGTAEPSGDLGFTAISINHCWGYEISSISVYGCSGTGIDVYETPLDKKYAAFCNGGNLSKISLHNNFIGIRFDNRAEYVSVVQINSYENVIGCIIHSGNLKITASNFCSNRDGILIKDKENGSHGSISNCLVNHNQRYAIRADGVRTGMAITGCCFYYGKIKLTDTVGINISSSQISCDMQIQSKGVNLLANNFLIPGSWEFDFSDSTLLTGNFHENGLWNPKIDIVKSRIKGCKKQQKTRQV